jgi:folate-binding protein YgfZ
MIPTVSPAALAYDAARHRAAVVDRSARGRIVVSGADRASYLQGLLTNDIEALKAGQGCYAAYLTAQGRMIADVYVYELGDVILLTLDAGVKDAVLAKLDQFIFSEDVQLGDVTATFAQIGIVGPEAATTVSRLITGASADALSTLAEHGNLRTEWSGEPAIVTRVTDTGEPGYDVFIDASKRGAFETALASTGVAVLDERTADAIRLEAGVPVFRRDMDEDTIPLEAGIEDRAISLTKGCYVGQEIIIRVLHRGHGRVARKLVGIEIDPNGSLPSHGDRIMAGARDVGSITSAVQSPARGRPIALGYVHRDFVQPGTALEVGGSAAAVAALPFVPVGREQAVSSPDSGEFN